jgi:hypothetical protein
MSNSKVRKQLEALEAKGKKYSEYKKIESLLLNYQMCKAYFHDQSASILTIVETILREKYNLPWQLKFIRRALMDARGKKNPTITIPQFKYEETEYDILSKFVKKNFDKMAADQKKNSTYPFAFRDLMEKNS